MRAVIPVAGVGSRLRPHTHTIPKVLLNVGGKPMIGYILDELLEAGITKATFITGHLGNMIEEYIKENYKEMQTDFVKQESLEGLGHAIYQAAPTFDDEDIFIILGDTIFDVDLSKVFDQKTSSLGVKEVEDPSRFGVAFVKDGRVEKLIEKPQTPVSNLALVGLYYIRNADALVKSLKHIIDKDIRTKGEIQLTDALQNMIENGEKITTFKVEGWYDCGKPETLLSTNKFLLDKNSCHKDSNDNIIVPPVYISDKAEIKHSIIGPYTTIAGEVKIKESVIKNSIVGEGSEVSKSILEGSIIGNSSVVKGAYRKLNIGDSTEIEFN